MKKKRRKKGGGARLRPWHSPRLGSAGPRVSESHGKERIRRKVIRRDGTGRYRGPRIKLGYLRNLMPHEPVFGTGEDPRASLSLLSSLFREGTIFLSSLYPLPIHPALVQRNIQAGIDTGDRSREWRKRIVRVPSPPRKSNVLNWKEKKREKRGGGKEERWKKRRNGVRGQGNTIPRYRLIAVKVSISFRSSGWPPPRKLEIPIERDRAEFSRETRPDEFFWIFNLDPRRKSCLDRCRSEERLHRVSRARVFFLLVLLLLCCFLLFDR